MADDVSTAGAVNMADGSPPDDVSTEDTSGDIMQALAGGDLPNQLAGMTSALQEQLLAISQEMNKLKDELYSEQGGLTSKLNDLQKAACSTQEQCHQMGAANDATSSSGRELRSRRSSADASGWPASSRELPSRDERGARQAGRHVEWAPGTDTRVSRENRRAAQATQRSSGWTPYIVAITLVTVGPLRGVAFELLGLLYGQLMRMLGYGRSDDDAGLDEDGVPWYDA